MSDNEADTKIKSRCEDKTPEPVFDKSPPRPTDDRPVQRLAPGRRPLFGN